ncbi:MAG: flavin reductase family protein [Eubacteriales bacterium]|jgi:flavin reductase (DIM6/NTAB) family NADH-FMN oxidoreductase RutF
MQKDLGSVMGLYPMPTTIVGTVLEDGRTNFFPVAHVGIPEHGHLMISIDKAHALDDKAIAQNGVVSVSLVSREMLEACDWCGIVKAENTNKSDVFSWHTDELEKAPVVEDAPVSMTCRVEQMVPVGNFHNYILKPVHTYVQEECLNERGKIDYEKVSPVLFEFQSAQYLSTGKVIAKCWNYGKNYR